jgi:hypothetical protein
MTNIPIDVPLPDAVKQYLAQPHCVDLALPKPSKVVVCLPLGGRLQGMVDATKAIPDDCALTFSLLLQLAPLMASVECVIKLLKLVKPLVDVIKAVPSLDVGKIAGALPAFIEAADDVIKNCVAGLVTNVPYFVRDFMLLIAKVLHCIGTQLQSIARLMGGLQISVAAAQAAGNTELLAQLQCAQENAANEAAGAMTAMDPLTVILALAEPIFGIIGAPTIQLPAMGSAQDADGLNTAADSLLKISDAIRTTAEVMPGCG